jgi:tetratricopeptide (TPR) repeat protein
VAIARCDTRVVECGIGHSPGCTNPSARNDRPRIHSITTLCLGKSDSGLFSASVFRALLMVVAAALPLAAQAQVDIASPEPGPQMAQAASAKPGSRGREPLVAQAFDHFYDMDYEISLREFTALYERHPDDPDAINHLLNAALFHELYRIGALSAGEYANDSFLTAPHLPADSRTCEQIRSLVQKALAIEDQRLQVNSKDVSALYARGVTKAEFATYTAFIERAWFSALRNAVSARHDHEKVLELDPANVDAKLIVGTHNYVVGNLPWALKTASSVVGLGGNKEKGLEYLHQAAAGGGEASIDAKILLIVFLRRERRYDESLQILRSLEPQYPHNVLFALEEGNLLNAKGDQGQAEQVFRRVWQDGRKGRYAGLHYELAATALGDLLRAQKKYSEAAAAYEEVGEVQKPDHLIAQKAALAAGEMYDLLQRRDLALKKYESVVALDAHSASAEVARKRMKEPYNGS